MATSIHAERIKAALDLLDKAEIKAGASVEAEYALSYDEIWELRDLIQILDAEIDSALNGGP